MKSIPKGHFVTNYQPVIVFFILALLFFMAPLALAQGTVSPTEAMRVANQNYEAGDYAEAIEIYESIVAVGVQDSTLYYNLGNAYYKQGDLGRAILNYRRAQHLAPRDVDVSTNLTIARSQTLDQLEQDNGLLTNFMEIAESWFTLTEALILALLLWLLIGVFAVFAILLKRVRRVSLWIIAVLSLFLLVGIVSMANRYYLQNTTPSGVIVAQEVDVTSGPGTGEQYVVEFNLHAGAEVRLLESRPGWRNIALPGGNFQGWVPAEAIEPVFPTD